MILNGRWLQWLGDQVVVLHGCDSSTHWLAADHRPGLFEWLWKQHWTYLSPWGRWEDFVLAQALSDTSSYSWSNCGGRKFRSGNPMANRAQVGVVDNCRGCILLSINKLNPLGGGPKAWPLHCVAPPNKLSADFMSAAERGKNGIPRTNSMLVSANKKVFSKNQAHPSLGARNLLRPLYRWPGLSYLSSSANIGVSVPGPSCAAGVITLRDVTVKAKSQLEI